MSAVTAPRKTTTSLSHARAFLGDAGRLFEPATIKGILGLSHLHHDDFVPFPEGMIRPNGVSRFLIPVLPITVAKIIKSLEERGVKVTHSLTSPNLAFMNSLPTSNPGWALVSNREVGLDDIVPTRRGDFAHAPMLFPEALTLLGLHMALHNGDPLFANPLTFKCPTKGVNLPGPETLSITASTVGHLHICTGKKIDGKPLSLSCDSVSRA